MKKRDQMNIALLEFSLRILCTIAPKLFVLRNCIQMCSCGKVFTYINEVMGEILFKKKILIIAIAVIVYATLIF